MARSDAPLTTVRDAPLARAETRGVTRYSLIVPVYKNEAFIGELIARCERLNHALDGALEVVLVVDGSPDRSYEKLVEALPKAGFASRLVALSRNFGSFAAIRAGLELARGPFFTMMAADLQEPEELVLDTFAALDSGDWDVVAGVRTARNDPWLTTMMSRAFWFLYRRMVQREVPRGGIDIFGCTLQVRDALLALEESHSTLVGLLLWLGFRRKEIGYVRLPRLHGKSAWSFSRKLKYLLDSTFAFSDLPIRILILTGAIGSLISVVVGLLILIFALTGSIAVPGYAPIMLTIFFATTVILFSLGILGSYIWRTFENTKRRPAHIAMIDRTFDRKGPVG